MASSSTAPVSPPLQPDTGEGLETPLVVPAASTEGNGGRPSSSSVRSKRIHAGSSLLRPWSVDFCFPRGGLGLDGVRAGAYGGSSLGAATCLETLSHSVELLRRWCPSTHTFLFSWGELTPTLEDVANHWMLPILGEHSFSNIKLSAEEEEIAAALRKRSSTRLSGWPSHFTQLKGTPVRRAAFVLYWLCKCTFGNFPCYSVNTTFIPLAIRISTGHCFPLAPLFLGHLYSQLDLLHDCEVEGDSCYILSAAFNTSALQTFFWEHSISYLFAAREKSAAWSRFSDLPQEFLDRFPDFKDNLPLVYRWVGLKTRDYDLVDALDHEENVLFRPYGDDHPGFTCASIFRKVLPAISFDPYSGWSTGDCTTCVADLTAFLKSRAFARWGGETTRVLIPGGHRLGFNTPSMGAYWQRFTQSMVEFVIAGRSDKTPIPAISYANSQKLGFAEWDGVRGGWIAYTIHLPEGWRSSVNVVEDRLIMLSKRGKGGKREAPVDQAIEKTSKKPAPSVPSSKKAPSKKTKAGKKSKSPLLAPSAAKESTTVPTEEPAKSTAAPSKKTKAGKEGKSTPLVPSAAKESTTVPMEEPAKSTVAPSKLKSVSASPSKKSSKKSAASRPPKGQKRISISSSSPDEEEPSAVSAPSPSKKKKFVAPSVSSWCCWPYEDLRQVTRASGRSGGGVVEVEGAPQTAAVDQDEELRKSVADSSEVGAESTGEDHSSSDDSFFDSAPDSAPEEQIVSAESTADDDDMPGADDSMPQTVLSSRVTGPDASIAHIMEGISLFGVTPSLRAIPAGGFVDIDILAGSHHSYCPMENFCSHGLGCCPMESFYSHGLGCCPMEDFLLPWTWLSSYGEFLLPWTWLLSYGRFSAPMDLVVVLGRVSTPMDLVVVLWKIFCSHGLGCRPMESFYSHGLGMDDTVHVSEDIGEVGITGEEFDAKAPNPHPEQYFWSFNGPLVPFGDFWVPNDCSPYLSRLSAGHANPSLEDVTTTRILAWRSVIQDLMDVGFDLGFMIERLRQTAQCLFGKRLADEIKALQHQIALLQDSLAELTAYQDEMMSTGRMVPRSGRGGSFLDSLLD
uniref:Aminotransferase-like plant mobile domain-containing protein n=1 Tax=Fagus sylvatica TaxID=28930 RepID=A0A2N9G1U9_FAGSY